MVCHHTLRSHECVVAWATTVQPSPESSTSCMCYDATMLDEFKQSTTTPYTDMKTTFKWTHFTSLKAWIVFHRHCVRSECHLNDLFHVYKDEYGSPIGECPWRSWSTPHLAHFPWVVRVQYTASNDEGTAIELSYWWKGDFLRYAPKHRNRIQHNQLPDFTGSLIPTPS